ncbi:hypothetical protein ACDQ55_11115 [Chitinophaga sp. 30R24]|uniref:HU domain-containing protein n=1 Tax=Chitinophaga sp. 30R24 TaxID=3248838 RepID=UPI003B90C4E1
MVIQQYIQEVLFKQRVCVVPQLGTFSVQHFPAHYNTATQTLTPPRDQVIFTQHWQDDGSCVEWIALKENLVPSVAQRKFEKYLEELKAELKAGKPLLLPGIGKLQGDFAGNVHFHAEELPLEMDTLDITPIERDDTKPPVSSSTDKASTIAPLEPIMTEEVEETLDAVTEEGGFKWWWAAIPIAMIVVGLSAWWYLSKINAPVPVPAQADTTTSIHTDTVAQQVAPPVPTDTLQQSAPTDSVANVVPASQEITYYTVIKTFKDSSAARLYQKNQESWGRGRLIIYKRDGLFRTALELHGMASDTTQQRDSISNIFKTKVYLEFP